jgi:CheY-like chemotaxis protein
VIGTFPGSIEMTPGAPSRRGVLVVDDEAFVRNVLVRTLRSLGAQAWAAAGGPEALAICAQHAPLIDLALIDLNLPGGMNGEDVAAALHRLNSGLPCCLMSGDRSAPLPPGFCCALAKPFSPGELAALLSSCTRTAGP